MSYGGKSEEVTSTLKKKLAQNTTGARKKLSFMKTKEVGAK